MSLGFVVRFGGTKRCPVLYGSKIWAILCVIVGKINNMLLCVKIMCVYIYIYIYLLDILI